MGKGGPGHWGNPGHPPLPADGHPGKLFLLLPSARPEKKKDLFSIREVARMRNITTWAPQLSMDKQNFHFCKIITVRVRGVGSSSGVMSHWLGLRGRWDAASGSVSSSRQHHTGRWTQRGLCTAPSTFYLQP